MEELIGKVPLTLEHGKTYVIELEQHMTREQYDAFAIYLRKFAKDNDVKFLVLDVGIKMAVVDGLIESVCHNPAG